MHPWHDYEVDEAHVAEHFPAIVEVPMGSKNKYESPWSTSGRSAS